MNSTGQHSTGTRLIVSVGMFFLTLSSLYSLGFVPSYLDGTTGQANTSNEVPLSAVPQLGEGTNAYLVPLSQLEHAGVVTAPQPTINTAGIAASLPTRIVIPTLNKDLPINNPTTLNVDALDTVLLKGPARYPTSAPLNANGNILLFGHSSHLPAIQIRNKMFQAFNGIETLKAGDEIDLYGGGHEYIYTVKTVTHENSTKDYIDLSDSGTKRLTLVTCDNFSAKTSRWVVRATLTSVQ